jgi:hypothetical protein
MKIKLGIFGNPPPDVGVIRGQVAGDTPSDDFATTAT